MWNAQIIKSQEFIISQKSFMNAQTLYMYVIHQAFLERNKTNLHYHYRSVRSLHYQRNGDYEFCWTARKQYLFS